MKRIIMASVVILLAVGCWKAMSGSSPAKPTAPAKHEAKATKPKDGIDKHISVGILVLAASVEKVEDVEKKNVGKTYELSLGAIITEPLEQEGQWRVLIGTENPIRIGGCACVFPTKPEVQVGQMVTVIGKYDHAEDADLGGRKVRILVFNECRIK